MKASGKKNKKPKADDDDESSVPLKDAETQELEAEMADGEEPGATGKKTSIAAMKGRKQLRKPGAAKKLMEALLGATPWFRETMTQDAKKLAEERCAEMGKDLESLMDVVETDLIARIERQMAKFLVPHWNVEHHWAINIAYHCTGFLSGTAVAAVVMGLVFYFFTGEADRISWFTFPPLLLAALAAAMVSLEDPARLTAYSDFPGKDTFWADQNLVDQAWNTQRYSQVWTLAWSLLMLLSCGVGLLLEVIMMATDRWRALVFQLSHMYAYAVLIFATYALLGTRLARRFMRKHKRDKELQGFQVSDDEDEDA